MKLLRHDFLYRVKLYIILKLIVIVFWHLILPFTFEASNSEQPSQSNIILNNLGRKSTIKSVLEDKRKILPSAFGVVQSSIIELKIWKRRSCNFGVKIKP